MREKEPEIEGERVETQNLAKLLRRSRKKEERRCTHTGIELLDTDSRVEEMCRMLGDSNGRKVTLDHARDMLERATDKKKRV